MKDMTIVLNKKIVNKESQEVRFVTKIDEEYRKIYSVPADQRDAEPMVMAAASYDRRWTLYVEPETPAPAAEPESDATKAVRDLVQGLADQDKQKTKGKSKAKTEAKPTEKTDDAPADPMKMGETITALEGIFDKLNNIYFEGKLPRPVITVQTTPKFYGHCTTKKVWKSEAEAMYEINLGAEFINRPKESTCCTLLHEMVHLYCVDNGITDTCQNGRYHNKTFKAECEARDLEVDYDRTNGYAYTKPTDAFKAKLADAGIDLTVRFARVMPKDKIKAEREKAHKYVCPICGQKVSTTAKLYLICGICECTMDRVD